MDTDVLHIHFLSDAVKEIAEANRRLGAQPRSEVIAGIALPPER